MILLKTSVFIAAIENFVLFGTFLALCMFAIAFVIGRLTIRQIWRLRPETLTHFYTCALVVPPLASFWLITAALFPRFWMTPEAFAVEHAAPLHEVHLFGAWTLAVEPSLAYATALFVVLIAVFVTWSNIRGSLRVGRVIKRLDLQAVAPPTEQVALVNQVASQSELSVGLVMSDYPFTFVWGFRHSKLILSSGLLRTLTPVELVGVLEHEAAHHVRRDNLIKLLLSLCSYSSLAFPLSRLIVGWRATEVEMICDEVAARRTSGPLEIAEALVKLRRQTTVGQPASQSVATPAIASSFVSDSALTFQRRVNQLLAYEDDRDSAASLQRQTWFVSRVGTLVLTASLVVLLAILLMAPMSVHHAIETLIEILR